MNNKGNNSSIELSNSSIENIGYRVLNKSQKNLSGGAPKQSKKPVNKKIMKLKIKNLKKFKKR